MKRMEIGMVVASVGGGVNWPKAISEWVKTTVSFEIYFKPNSNLDSGWKKEKRQGWLLDFPFCFLIPEQLNKLRCNVVIWGKWQKRIDGGNQKFIVGYVVGEMTDIYPMSSKQCIMQM